MTGRHPCSPIRPGLRTSDLCSRPASDFENATMIHHSVITCPHCGTAKSEAMPTDACQFFYECTGCGARLRPKQGDCCVFCSYGSVPCPPIQAERAGEGGGGSPLPPFFWLG